jgi:hypothetical protein
LTLLKFYSDARKLSSTHQEEKDMAISKINRKSLEPLKQVRLNFSEFRSRQPKCGKFPINLRKIAVDAVVSGIRHGEVASAAGVSLSTLHAWRRAIPCRARELVLVPDRTVTQTPTNQLARMTFGGILIEFPVSAITSSLLREIAGATL